MAQIVKLKRTAVSGKIPTTSNLELGELAMNTYDGRIFFEKDSGTPTVNEILTTNTENYITGSLKLNGAVTASYFVGDGSQLTNLPSNVDVSEVVTVTASFDNQSTINVAHNFDSKNVIVSVYDSNDNQIIPQTVSLTNSNSLQVVLSAAQSGFVVVAKGGHIVSGSADDSNNLNGQPASYYLDYGNFTNIPSGIISSSVQIVSSLSNQDVDFGTGDVTATTGSFDVIDLDKLSLTSTQTTVPPLQLTATSLQDGVGALRIDSVEPDIYLNDTNGGFATVTFANNGEARTAFGRNSGDDFYLTVRDPNTNSGNWRNDTFVADSSTGNISLGYDLTVNGNINATNGIVSGSSQITDLTTHKETVSGASSYAITHNLNESYPIVQAWNTSTSQQEVPQTITTNSANQVTVVFSSTFAGVIIVKK